MNKRLQEIIISEDIFGGKCDLLIGDILQLQLSKSDYKRLLHKPYVNEVYLTGQNPNSKCCQYLEIQYTVRKKSRSFNAKNFGSVGQRAAKLLAVKFGVLKKKSATLAIPAEVFASACCPGLNTRGVESFSKFDSWQL